MDEFLVGGGGVDRRLEGDDARRDPSCRPTAQRQFGPARELAAGGGVARRLREAGMGADAHHGVDPMRPRDGVDGRAQHRRRVDVGTGGEGHGELVGADAAEHRAGRQHLLQPLGDRDGELVAAEHAELGIDVGHAVELDQREAGDLVAGAFGQRQIEQFEHLGMVGQTGELVLVGGAARLRLAHRQFAPGAQQLPQRQAGKAHQ